MISHHNHQHYTQNCTFTILPAAIPFNYRFSPTNFIKFDLYCSGGKVKKQWRSEFNWDGLVSKFSALSYYDQHQVVSAGIAAMMEMLCGFSMGSGGYLPLIDHVAHLTQLMESCLYITGLLDFCNQVIKSSNTSFFKLLKINALSLIFLGLERTAKR